jgi:FkbM family methyltransferase
MKTFSEFLEWISSVRIKSTTVKAIFSNFYQLRKVRSVRQIFPIPRLFPLSSFIERLIKKNSHTLSWYLLSRMRITGSTFHGIDHAGNGVLCLNQNSPLGKKGNKISVPVDNVIFQWVSRRGRWEEDESTFLANHVNQSISENILFIDIGGQAGLVTRQFFLRLVRPISIAWIVEPFSAHISAIKNNCHEWIGNGVLRIFPYALDNKDSQRKLYIQNTNSGNATLVEILDVEHSKSYSVQAKSVAEFEKLLSPTNSSIVIKCDIQGMDSKVLRLFSTKFWDQVTCCVIEIWPIQTVETTDVDYLMDRWEHFTFLSWGPTLEKKCTLEEVKQFWLSQTGSTRNLYISA